MTLIATTRKLVLYPGNTQGVQLLGVQDQTTGLFWGNTATIICTLEDDQGVVITGCFEVPFVFQTGSQGNFLATFWDQNFQPVVGNNYTLIIDGSQGSSILHLEVLTEIRQRQY